MALQSVNKIEADEPVADVTREISLSFDQDFMDRITAAASELDVIAEERKEVNAKKNLVISRLEKYGLNRHAVTAVFRYLKLDEDARDNFDLSYAIARKATGSPLQDDLFEASATHAVKKHTQRKRK